MNTVTPELPDEALRALHVDPSPAGPALRLADAMKLFEFGRLSSGAAAILAVAPRIEFFTRLMESLLSHTPISVSVNLAEPAPGHLLLPAPYGRCPAVTLVERFLIAVFLLHADLDHY